MSCPVCFGGEDAAVRESLNAGIGVLLGVTAIVLACFVRFFFGLLRRSRTHGHLVGLPRTGASPAGADLPLLPGLPIGEGALPK